MIKFIRKIKELYNLSSRISDVSQCLLSVEIELRSMDERINAGIDRYLKHGMSNQVKEFEKKIQEMTFAYTANLDDTKSDYLKRYVEQRLEGMQHQLTQLPYKIDSLTSKVLKLENKELMDDAE